MKQIGKGKIRDIYDVGDYLVLVTSDRISAFDVVMPDMVPFKGSILNRLSAFWFDFTKEVIPNHKISIRDADMPRELQYDEYEGCCMLVKKLKILPIECIVRGYITGSGWETYKENGTICGIKLPKGLEESEKLSVPIFTPTTKVTKGHDENISFEQTAKLIGEELATEVRNKSIEIYSMCADYAKNRGIIIADTKFEFGLDKNGNLVLADELLTPDSSRFWPVESYKVGRPQDSYDKQFLRNYLMSIKWNKKPPAPKLPKYVIDIISAKYIEAFEALTGEEFY